MAYERLIDIDTAHVRGTTDRFATQTVARPQAVRDGASSLAMTRLLDIVFATIALVFLAPLLIVIAVVCRLQDGGPSLFAQRRQGQNGRVFPCFKFRSMVVDADVRLAKLLETDAAARAEWDLTHKLLKDPRITPWGQFLRKSSLDELPQLFNVLRGEMSLVGPRPIVAAEMQRYGRFIADYNSVLPGITGLWQVSGRSDTNYHRRVALDVLYIRRRSLKLYLYILFMTVPAVIMRKGAC